MTEITVSELNYSFDGKQNILSDINFQAKKEETIGIIGANGSGKSTLLRLIAGQLSNYTGNITIDGIHSGTTHYSFIQKQIGFLVQDFNDLLLSPSVYDNIAKAPREAGLKPLEVHCHVIQALEEVNMIAFKRKFISKLSIGQKKLIAFASILSQNPIILLLDDPSASLDPLNRREFIYILNRLHEIKLIASQDLDFICDTCDRTIVLHNKTIVADGNTIDILTNQKLLEENGLLMPLSLRRHV